MNLQTNCARFLLTSAAGLLVSWPQYGFTQPSPVPNSPMANSPAETTPTPEPKAVMGPAPTPDDRPAMSSRTDATAPSAKSSSQLSDAIGLQNEKIEKMSDEAKNLTLALKGSCERHYQGVIQSEVRAACSSAGTDFIRLNKMGATLPQTRCRINYGEEPRLVMACLVGNAIAEDLLANRDSYKKKLQLCAENYPAHNEIDTFLQESCLTGIHLPSHASATESERFATCARITPERSFLGPCAVGVSLALEQVAEIKVAPASQNKMCDQYFNLNRFHKGYRACLNARSLALELPSKVTDALKSCANISSEANNDTERAACLVGLTIYRHLLRQDDVSKRFQKCGSNKVTYQDRDFLACLTAASLLDFTDRNGAEGGCREVFRELRSHSRGDCLSSLSLF